MRHRIRIDRFGRFSSYHKATIKSIVSSILIHQKITTTKAKAKAARRLIEKVITLGKQDNLSSRRRAFSLLSDHRLVKILFDQIAPQFVNKTGGYTRVIAFGNRRGDNAQLVILELTQKYKTEKPKQKLKEKSKEKEKPVQTEIKPEQKQEPKEEKPVKLETEEKKEIKQPPTSAHPEERKHKRPETKKPNRFFKGFKGFFKKERDSL